MSSLSSQQTLKAKKQHLGSRERRRTLLAPEPQQSPGHEAVVGSAAIWESLGIAGLQLWQILLDYNRWQTSINFERGKYPIFSCAVWVIIKKTYGFSADVQPHKDYQWYFSPIHVLAPWIDSLIQRHQNSAKKKAPCFYCVLPTAALPFSSLRKKTQTALQLAAKPWILSSLTTNGSFRDERAHICSKYVQFH